MANGQWYITIGEQEQGPFDNAQIRDFVTSGQLTPTMRIRRGDMPKSVPASSVKGLFAPVDIGTGSGSGRLPAAPQPPTGSTAKPKAAGKPAPVATPAPATSAAPAPNSADIPLVEIEGLVATGPGAGPADKRETADVDPEMVPAAKRPTTVRQRRGTTRAASNDAVDSGTGTARRRPGTARLTRDDAPARTTGRRRRRPGDDDEALEDDAAPRGRGRRKSKTNKKGLLYVGIGFGVFALLAAILIFVLASANTTSLTGSWRVDTNGITSDIQDYLPDDELERRLITDTLAWLDRSPIDITPNAIQLPDRREPEGFVNYACTIVDKGAGTYQITFDIEIPAPEQPTAAADDEPADDNGDADADADDEAPADSSSTTPVALATQTITARFDVSVRGQRAVVDLPADVAKAFPFAGLNFRQIDLIRGP